MRIALLHDYFDKPGGGERVALALAEAFDADIYTGYVDYESTYDGIKGFNVTEIAKGIKVKGLKTIYLLNAFRKLALKNYDFFIFSGTNCITASALNRPNLWYCHTPARHLYDLKSWMKEKSPVHEKLLLKALGKYQLGLDRKYVGFFDRIVANSVNVKSRLVKFYGKSVAKKTSVVYPPVDTEKFRWAGQGNFYLSAGRLDKLKRVDMIIKAFKKMPDKNLVVASSGPEAGKIKALVKGSKNTKVIGYLPEKEMARLMGRCIASIYIPVDEDFGLSAAESLAAGKPCIAADEGGLREIVDRKTGVLIQPSEESIISAVGWLDAKRAGKMRMACEKKAGRFSRKSFIRKMKNIVYS